MSSIFGRIQRAGIMNRAESKIYPVVEPCPAAGIPRVVAGLFDTADATNKSQAGHGLGVIVPAGAQVTRMWYDVETTFTTANDSGTLAISIEAANDLIAAIAISDASNPWDHAATAVFPTLASHPKTTVDRELTVTVGTQNLTAGKMRIYLEYVLAGN